MMNKTILITGCSSGIGRATAKFFQEKGWNVVATVREPDKEEELTQLKNVLVSRLDVTDSGSIAAAIEQAVTQFGKIDVVVNNAGYGVTGIFESASRDSIRHQFEVNVFGLMDVTQQIIPHFRKNRSGMFINISSVGGKVTMPLMPLYHSTKFAVEGFSESLSYELAPLGIKVKIVEPGGVSTNFFNSMDLQHQSGLSAEYDELVEETQKFWHSPENLKTWGQPKDVAAVIYTAATDGKDTLRYVFGKDAEQMLADRASMDDAQFMQRMKQML